MSDDAAFAEMASAMKSRSGFGDATILLFKKGDWVAGPDAERMNDEELIALVRDLVFGWTRWQDKKPITHCLGLVRNRFKPPARGALGDNDPTKWEKGKDPWEFTYYLPLVSDDGGTFVYSTSSRGGADALANLQDSYVSRGVANAAKLPRVRLAGDHYDHPTFSRVETPELAIVDWTDAPQNLRPLKLPPGTSLEASPALAQPARMTITSGGNALNDGIDDDIPF